MFSQYLTVLITFSYGIVNTSLSIQKTFGYPSHNLQVKDFWQLLKHFTVLHRMIDLETGKLQREICFLFYK